MKFKLDDYYVSELAKFYGVSADTIRVYDRRGIISPAKNEDNNYRVYTKEDFVTMDYVMRLRRLDIPLEGIRYILESGEIGETHRVISEREKELEMEIQALLKQQRQLQFYHKKIKECMANLGKIEIVNKPPFIAKKIEKTMAEVMDSFDRLDMFGVNTMPMLAVTNVNHLDIFSDYVNYAEIVVDRKKRQQESDYIVVLEDTNLISADPEFPTEEFIILPEGRYVHAYVEVYTNRDYSQVENVIKQISELNLKIKVPSFSVFLSESHHCDKETEYIELWFPIE